jgi:DUF1680 family protein
MGSNMLRRDFLKTAPATAFALTQAARMAAAGQSEPSPSRIRIQPFDFQGVRLGKSRWQEQFQSARDVYFNVPDDDILHGFRAAAGLPAPGKPLGGWCQKDSSTVFGQWLSGMARMYRATGDSSIRDKAVRLMTGFAKTVKPDGNTGMRHYPFDKLVCGLVDMQQYAGHADAVPLLEKITDAASRTFSRENLPAVPNKMYGGRPSEWYTLSENLFRAYQLTGNPKFRTFAEVWLYPAYWDKFANTASPTEAHGVHAYSHVNTFSSAAMAYAVEGDSASLRIIKNAYDFLQDTQCYGTGGFGPRETIVPSDGRLGRALEITSASFECGCGSWAGFKLSRYLMQFTGEARYGDWIERLFYNGVGGGLPIAPGGRNFYYADYRVAGGMKTYNWETYTCCSGTYIQDVADFHNLIYFRDASSLYVNLYVPSEVTWARTDGPVTLTQDTAYPQSDLITMTLGMKRSTDFSLKFRVPEWTRDVSVKVNGAPVDIPCTPGTWATIARTWNAGDRVEIRIPMRFRMVPVDRQHADRVLVVRGPAVLVLESDFHENAFRLPERDDDLAKWLVEEKTPGVFQVVIPGGGRVASKMRPYYSMEENYPYKMYFDAKSLPFILM